MTTRRPNIIVIQADQMAPHCLGAYGDEAAKTPNIDALAEEGAVFDRAYCNTPLCAPSRASMMTGRMPSHIDCFDNGDDFAASEPTFAHRLRSVGYHTALIGRMHFIGPDQQHGFEERLTTDVYPADLDMIPDWGRSLEDRLQWYHDADSVFTAGVSKATVQQDFDDEVIFRSLRHLSDRVRANQAASDVRPFLMVTSFIHPHDPYEPPREHWDRFADVEIPDPRHPQVPDAQQDPHTHRLRAMSGFDRREPALDDVRRARRAYYAAVSYIDDHIGRIRERVEELGLAENTVIIVTSDHGDMLGEKGLWYKMSPYEQSSRVPMIVHGPADLVSPGRFDSPVCLLDLLPTLTELSGAPATGPVEGVSLLETARRERSGDAGTRNRDIVIEYLAEGTLRPQLTIVRDRLKYVCCPGDPDQLFDLAEDPDELRNRARDPEYAEALVSLRGVLDAEYDLAELETRVLGSQDRRRLVQHALGQGRVHHWDFSPVPEQRYVRGDFWNALEYGKIPDPTR
ncbi:choline-sulfatase [Brevibacterium sanguinis]|uniref:Choline-sulfatase n=2 Tax=Brevibacterium TaxID=1696 RepID=A0A366IIX0_9MICO|nr:MULTISPECIES: choline-sulfatase [Brevibacterium]RBP65007.1 choline-sulfatase [Brevibacterium sanguinis]RBP71270.1 choline-sulfatase [Brevibacterium celere]